VSSTHALDLAATTAALCLLAQQLPRAAHVRRLQISLLAARAEVGHGGGPSEVLADRNAQLVGLVLRALRESLRVNCSLRCAPACPPSCHCSGALAVP
jgi:hypothetical protein